MSAPSLLRVRLIAGLASLAVNAAALGALLQSSQLQGDDHLAPAAVFALVEIERTTSQKPSAPATRPQTGPAEAEIVGQDAPTLRADVASMAPMAPLAPLPIPAALTHAEEDAYARAVWSQLAAHRPRAAGPRRTARVRFALNADGTLRTVQLDQSSGDAAFDAACLRTVSDAAPFPMAPPGARSDLLVFVAPMSTR